MAIIGNIPYFQTNPEKYRAVSWANCVLRVARVCLLVFHESLGFQSKELMAMIHPSWERPAMKHQAVV